jgi:hypothetical protein
MSQQVQLQLPDHLVRRLREISESSQFSFEEMAVAAMKRGSNEPGPVETPVEVMAAYTDDQLWAVVDQRLAEGEDENLDSLLEKRRDNTITAEEELAIRSHMDKLNHQMLERTKALMVLQERGHDIPAYIKTGKR